MVAQTLVKRLGVIDTLGSVSTICSDKTGTLTQNKMTVAHVLLHHKGGARQVHKASYLTNNDHQLSPGFQRLFRAAILCTRTSYETSASNLSKPPGSRELLGDATEKAIFRFCDQVAATHLNPGPVTEDMRKSNPKAGEIPFSSRNKWQASVHSTISTPDSPPRYFLVVKGAPERVMDLCTNTSFVGGGEGPTQGWQASARLGCEELGSMGERVLAFAETEITDVAPGTVFTDDRIMECMTDMTFLGLITMQDPPRLQVPAAIQLCQRAGINVVMVTGDFASTAVAIASQVGIISEAKKSHVRTGKSLLKMSESELEAILEMDGAHLPPLLVTGDEINRFNDVSTILG